MDALRLDMARKWHGAVIALAWLLGCGTGGDDGGGSSGGGVCVANATEACPCSDGTMATKTCRSDGLGFSACLCPIPGGAAPPGMMWPAIAGSTPVATAGTTGGVAGVAPMSGGVGGVAGALGTAGSAGLGGMSGSISLAGTGGSAGSGIAGAGTSGSGGTGPVAGDDLDALRQLCVDEINMYRATLSLPPLARATPAQEACSDMGAKQDADSGQAHGSAGNCQGLGGQDTCPGWGVGGFSGNATVGDALTGCLGQMWAEGPPPVPEDECIADYVNCFLKHGHWMNMSNDNYQVVSCGFYEMPDGKWWMNQDFG